METLISKECRTIKFRLQHCKSPSEHPLYNQGVSPNHSTPQNPNHNVHALTPQTHIYINNMSSTTAHPTELVIIPGSFSYSGTYDAAVEPLRAKGYTVHVLDPPCYPGGYKPNTPSPSMYDDAKFINSFVTKLADEGKDVVIMPHSYGGTPASESLKGITKKERAQQGKKGGVVRMGYMTCIVPKVGENLGQVISAAASEGGGGGVPPIDIDEFGWMSQPRPDLVGAMVFNYLPVERQIEEAKKFGKHSSTSFGDALTYPGYKDLPVSWLFCEDDLCVVPQVQQTAIDAIEESWQGTEREGKKVDVLRVKCDHVPTLSAKEETIKWIEDIIAKGGQE